MKHDLALLARYAENRSPDAFAELVREHAGMVYGTCLRITRNPQDAEDASQECFLELARKADAVRSSVSGWLHKAALNHALGAVRKAASRRHHEGEAMAETSKDTGPTWEEVTDRETRLKIVRTIESNPMPEDALPELKKRFAGKRLKADVRKFLAGRPTLYAWMARKAIGITEPGDKDLCKNLIDERVAAQRDDGSWACDVVQTARYLRELSDLGGTTRNAAVAKGAEWLLNRSESKINPGMFFLNDRLVAKQADIYAKRRVILESRGWGGLSKLRMPNPTKSQKRRLMAGDDVLESACGFVIWPTAFVLEALLPLGYEKHPRVKRCIESLMHGYIYWCECNYQMGAGLHSRRPIPGKKQLDEREADCIREFLAGGRPDASMDRMKRLSHKTARGADVYEVELGDHMQPCEVITMRALRHSRSAIVRRAAEVHLWRFAAIQNSPDGTFGEPYVPRQAHMLQVYSYHDLPISRLVIMKSIPWIVSNQNRDGSWGKAEKKDAMTLAVVQALLSVRSFLPPNLRP